MVFNRLIYIMLFSLPSLVLSADSSHGSVPHLNGEELAIFWVIGESRWDLIHFNFGLWDWYGWKQEQKATPASYAKNLDGIIQKLKKTNAKLVFNDLSHLFCQ